LSKDGAKFRRFVTFVRRQVITPQARLHGLIDEGCSNVIMLYGTQVDLTKRSVVIGVGSPPRCQPFVRRRAAGAYELSECFMETSIAK
jgi:hypothetical protein